MLGYVGLPCDVLGCCRLVSSVAIWIFGMRLGEGYKAGIEEGLWYAS